ncbi:MAG: NTP transferase domain-containing protein [Dehalococcoidia bacterium]|nr:NTP transferase domain-containing protein [Dehalococcoidia bacterium]
MKAVAIVPAAGESSRMGFPKPLLPWGPDGATLLAYQVAELQAAGCDEVIVVTGSGSDAVSREAEAAGAITAHNEDWRSGPASSLRRGAAAAPIRDAIVLLKVDQPRSRDITGRLLGALASGPEVPHVPAYAGRRGHPPVVPGVLLDDLRAVDEESRGLHRLMDLHPPVRVEFDDPLVLADLNDRAAYEYWHRRLFGFVRSLPP